MNIKYIGRRKEITLKPPVVSEDTTFDKKNGFKATVSQREGLRLIAENPRTFVEVPEVIPDVLTEKYLKGKDPDELEDIAFKKFGVDLDRRESKTKLIKQILDLQKQADEKEEV